ncbi:AP-1-like transcription factor napA [Lachnellula cervina]|uniref:Putative transcription factor kapC n=1 Tax=Lachnellula cervina TaxID=1316786 RepID=A0A7D8UTK5_9HELO|nr:AP-1-like transcription factor napA [Lachnellula cervina]
MATEQQYGGNSVDTQLMPMPADLTPGLYDGTSSESSVSSPMNNNNLDNFYNENGYMAYAAFPMQYPVHGEGIAPTGLVPIELEIDGLYEDYDRRRKKNGGEKIVSGHVHSRRRAQNRASQRAFRDRKEKHMRELEQQLGELEGRHNDLSRSYDSLQVEYTSVKHQLEGLRGENARLQSSSRSCQAKEYDVPNGEILDPCLFDVSAFCFDQEDLQDRTV